MDNQNKNQQTNGMPYAGGPTQQSQLSPQHAAIVNNVVQDFTSKLQKEFQQQSQALKAVQQQGQQGQQDQQGNQMVQPSALDIAIEKMKGILTQSVPGSMVDMNTQQQGSGNGGY